MPKVFGVGLPRSGGQTLQNALARVLGGSVFHSPGADWEKMGTGFTAAVEVFAPIDWLLHRHPDAKFIINVRDQESWYQSCERVYEQSRDWNNPLWKYPIYQFRDYYEEYLDSRMSSLSSYPGPQCLVWDLTQDPHWNALCKFLDVPEPEYPFPNIDAVGRPPEAAEELSYGAQDWRMSL